MRVTTAFNRLLRLDGINVTDVTFGGDTVVVTVRLRRTKLVCPLCGFSTRTRYDTRPVPSWWRHLDLGSWRLVIKADLRRLSCPEHGQRVEAVPFARHRARFTGDFESLVAWLATKMDKAAIQRLVRVDWDTVGRICERVVTDELDPHRLDDLFEIGVDEISWKKHHNYVTLVANHRTGRIVWGHEGKNAATLDKFFNELGPERSEEITAVSMDMGPAFAKSVRKKDHAPQAVICYDPFHVVKLATDALEKVRRAHWRRLWDLDDRTMARKFKGARWALLKNPENLTDTQEATLTQIKRDGGAMWRAYQRKEELRAIFAGDLNDEEVADMLDRWCARVQRSRLEPFVKAGRTIREHREGILAAIRLGINNGRIEGLNNRVRLIIRRAYGFHSPQAALALVMLSCGPIQLVLPHEQT